MKKERLEQIYEFLKNVPDRFTGRIELNFFMGGITNINKLESFKVGEEKKNGI